MQADLAKKVEEVASLHAAYADQLRANRNSEKSRADLEVLFAAVYVCVHECMYVYANQLRAHRNSEKSRADLEVLFAAMYVCVHVCMYVYAD